MEGEPGDSRSCAHWASCIRANTKAFTISSDCGSIIPRLHLQSTASHARLCRARPGKPGLACQKGGCFALPFWISLQTQGFAPVGTCAGLHVLRPVRRPCLCDTAQGLFAPLRTSDEGLSRHLDHSSEPSSSDTMTGAFVPLRPRPVLRHRLRTRRRGSDPFFMREHPDPAWHDRGCKSPSGPGHQNHRSSQ